MRCAILAGALLLLTTNNANAEIHGLADEGWHTWRVPAVASAPDWCCYNWNSGVSSPATCVLDSDHISYGNGNDDEVANESGEMQLYVHTRNGEVKRIRALSAHCPVETNSQIMDLGPQSADDSVDWLQSKISPHSELSSPAIAAIAVHAGDRARDVLVDNALQGDDRNTRRDAVFWMGQVRVAETADELKRIINNDDSLDVRKHAAFSYSQSTADDRFEVLISVVENRQATEAERKHALFWLAESGDDSAYTYLDALLARN